MLPDFVANRIVHNIVTQGSRSHECGLVPRALPIYETSLDALACDLKRDDALTGAMAPSVSVGERSIRWL